MTGAAGLHATETRFTARRLPTILRFAIIWGFCLVVIAVLGYQLLFGQFWQHLRDGQPQAWLMVLFLLGCPSLLFDSLAQLRDRGPNLVLRDDGFRYRWHNHDYGFFPWDQVAAIEPSGQGRRGALVVEIRDRRLIRPRIDYWRWLATALGAGALLSRLEPPGPEGRLVIMGQATGDRLREAGQAMQAHLESAR